MKNTELSKLGKGETVIIYQDPHTKENPEGEFVLHTCLKVSRFSTFQTEEWMGHFYGDSRTLQRTITVLLTEDGEMREGQDL